MEGQHAATQPPPPDVIQVAIVCALPIESTAVLTVFDHTWTNASYSRSRNDSTEYTVGRIGEHNVVLAHLPRMGSVPATAAIKDFLATFTNIEFALLVGICGGAPLGEDGKEIVLGDVAVSDSVVQYDFGRRFPDKLRRKDNLSRPRPRIESFLHKIRTTQMRIALEQRLVHHLEQMTNGQESQQWKRPSSETDILFEPTYRHKHQQRGTCETCDRCQQDQDPVCEAALTASCSELGCDNTCCISRDRLQKTDGIGSSLRPTIHFGPVASANQVMKSAADRDAIVADENCIALEMEGAGLWEYVPTIILKSVCDYADSHKNKQWQTYATAVAASCAKALLEQWTPTELASYREQFQIPNRRIRYFRGREETLSRLEGILESSGAGQRVAVLQGLGGVGKTQVTLEYCHRKKTKPFQCIIWLNASSESSIKAGFGAAVEMFVTRSGQPSRADPTTFVLQKLVSLTSPWLLILDNYDDVSAYNILDYFPNCDHGAILVTSRSRATDHLVQDQTQDFVELTGLDRESAISLLLQQSNHNLQSPAIRHTAARIVERLGEHPLAIVQAAAYIKQQRLRLDSFIDKYEKQRDSVLQTVPRLSQYRTSLGATEDETALNVFTTWNLSFKHLEDLTSKDSIECRLLILLSVLDCSDVSEELIFANFRIEKVSGIGIEEVEYLRNFFSSNQWDHDLFLAVLDSLAEHSLCQIYSTRDDDSYVRVQLHPLIKDWIQLRSDLETIEGMSRVVLFLLTDANLRNNQSGDILEKIPLKGRQDIISHLVALSSTWKYITSRKAFILTSFESYWRAALLLARFPMIAGFCRVSAEFCEVLLPSARFLLGEIHDITIALKAALGNAWRASGRYEDSLKLDIEVHQASQQLYGEDSRTLIAMNKLGRSYQLLAQHTKALAIHGNLVEMSRKIHGETHPDTLNWTLTLARSNLDSGKHEKALKLANHVAQLGNEVDCTENVLGVEAKRVCVLIECHLKHFDTAFRLQSEVVKELEALHGRKDPICTESRSRLASILLYLRLSEGQSTQDAIDMQLETIKRCADHFGEKSWLTLKSMEVLAYLLSLDERLDEAKVRRDKIKELEPLYVFQLDESALK